MVERGEDLVTTFFLDSTDAGAKYKIITSSEDAKRITTDITFATSMFMQAKKSHQAVSCADQARKDREAAACADQARKDREAAACANQARTDREAAACADQTRRDREAADTVIAHPRTFSPICEPSDDSGSEVLEAFLPVDTQSDDPDNRDDPDDTNSSTINPQPGDTCHWTTAMCLLLLTSYQTREKNFSSGKMSQTQAWDIISKEMKLKNYKVSGLKCQSKLASLKKTYKKTKDHNKKSGNQRKTWTYLAKMDEIFGTKPWVNPMATTSSTSTQINPDSNLNKAADESCTRKRKSNTADYLKNLVDEKIKARKSKEVQHEQKLDEVRKMNTLLEKILSKN